MKDSGSVLPGSGDDYNGVSFELNDGFRSIQNLLECLM